MLTRMAPPASLCPLFVIPARPSTMPQSPTHGCPLPICPACTRDALPVCPTHAWPPQHAAHTRYALPCHGCAPRQAGPPYALPIPGMPYTACSTPHACMPHIWHLEPRMPYTRAYKAMCPTLGTTHHLYMLCQLHATVNSMLYLHTRYYR